MNKKKKKTTKNTIIKSLHNYNKITKKYIYNLIININFFMIK